MLFGENNENFRSFGEINEKAGMVFGVFPKNSHNHSALKDEKVVQLICIIDFVTSLDM